ncbi:alpha/beta hydrolase [Roseomonas sp. CECT 9278]|uniref:alpha/beta hydrolase n=1 Tax=Roseomonas sp. CECT 9278 TaxID=2845823 RepID=UPI001E31E532|nr:alpha/beta hydrolase [Roseomonas sp. CECT 9278]CAH0259195.1 Monoacylglycerol lipase [Roseomonas sp. CECT 9278]
MPRRAVLAGLALPACTPARAPMGPPVIPPGIADDALVMPDGARLPLHAWLPPSPPRAVVIGLHGMNEHARAFAEDAAPWFTSQGVALYAYDQRGFGGSPNRGIWAGHETMAADATQAARLVRARHPGVPLVLMGESMGGAVLLVAGASASPPPVDGYVLLAPAVVGRASLGWFARGMLDALVTVVPMMGFANSAPGFQPTDNIAAWQRWSRDPLLIRHTRVDALAGLVDLMDAAVAAAPRFQAPALLLYGGRDRLVPAGPTRRLLATLPPDGAQRIGFYPGGYHMLLRDTQGALVAGDITAWAADRRAILPSGAEAAARAWLAA